MSSENLVSHSHEVRSSSIDVKTFLSSILAWKRSKPYVIVPEACATELLNITVPVSLDALLREPKQMIPLSIGTISVFLFLAKMSHHKHNTGSWLGFLFCCFGRRNGYQRVPTESDEDIIRSCSGSGEEEGVSASRFRQERDESIDAQRQLQKQKEINNALQIRISEREERIMQHTQEIEFMRTRLKEEEKEKQEVLNRLSEHISLKLADNNPNIADLSDLNRPTKLAEKFSLLYDDQWTDAFDALQQRPEFKVDSKAIKQLLEILMTCYQLCREQADKHMRTMLSINNITLPLESVSIEMKKLMKETRKKCASAYVPLLYQIVIDLLSKDYEELIKAEKLQIYINRCTELCWLMAVQDPPMALTGEVGEGAAYKKTEYREYTKSGPVVDYVVWPAVLIQDNGDLIAKGIVQCRDVKEATVSNFKEECDSGTVSEQDLLISKGDRETHFYNAFSGISDDKADKTDVVQKETSASGQLYTLDHTNEVDGEITELLDNDDSPITELSETKVIQGINKDVTGEVKDIKINTMIESLNEGEESKDTSNESDPQENRSGELFDTHVRPKDTFSSYTGIIETKEIQEVNADASCGVNDTQDAVIASSQDKESMISDEAGHNENVLLDTGNSKISETDNKEAKTDASEGIFCAETVRALTPDKETVILENSNAESVNSKDSSEQLTQHYN